LGGKAAVASATTWRAERFGLIAKACAAATRSRGKCRPMPVLTTPGWRAATVSSSP
jgi:hypothetical protein